jgi:hypothetical protein
MSPKDEQAQTRPASVSPRLAIALLLAFLGAAITVGAAGGTPTITLVERAASSYTHTTPVLVQAVVSPANVSATMASAPTPPNPDGNISREIDLVEGWNNLTITATDALNETATLEFSIILDTTPPTGSVTIVYTGQTMEDFLLGNPGCCNATSVAKARGVIVFLDATDNFAVADFELSTSLYFPGAVWSAFSPGAHYFELSPGDGVDKSVFVRFRDASGLESQAFTDQISLDTTPPLGSIIINHGDEDTTDPLLSLNLEASDNFAGALQFRLARTPDFAGAIWLPFSDTARFEAGTDAGRATVYYQVRDANGWESLTYSDSIMVHGPLPPSLSMTVNGTATTTVTPGSPVQLSVDLGNQTGLTVAWFVDGAQVGTGRTTSFTFSEGTHNVSAAVSNGAETQSYPFTVEAPSPAPGPGPGPTVTTSDSGPSITLVIVALGGAATVAFLVMRRSRS